MPENKMKLDVKLNTGIHETGFLATADVTMDNLYTVRNVKIALGDYGAKVVMPRTKMPGTGRFKDAVYFADSSLRQSFDKAVLQAYGQTQGIGCKAAESMEAPNTQSMEDSDAESMEDPAQEYGEEETQECDFPSM